LTNCEVWRVLENCRPPKQKNNHQLLIIIQFGLRPVDDTASYYYGCGIITLVRKKIGAMCDPMPTNMFHHPQVSGKASILTSLSTPQGFLICRTSVISPIFGFFLYRATEMIKITDSKHQSFKGRHLHHNGT